MGRKYEALVIYPSSMKEEEFDKALNDFVSEIDKLSGKVVGIEKMGIRQFARPLKKQESGYYVRVGFEMDPDKLDKFNTRLKLKGDIFRIQILAEEKNKKETSKAAKKE